MCRVAVVYVSLLLSVFMMCAGRVSAQSCPSITNVQTVDADCSGNGASITITATGGTGTLEYSIDGTNYQTSNVFNNAPVGTFFAYVRDAICSSSQQGTIYKRCLTIQVDTTNPGCNNNDGTITIIVQDGFPAYSYFLNGSPIASPNITGLAAGIYKINVADSRGQTTFVEVHLQMICIQATVTPGDATCGQNNGTLDVNASGGVAPYGYSVDGGPFLPNAHITGLAPGTHTVGVNDSQGNSMATPVSVTINGGASPTMTATPTAATCVNNDGTVVINGAGGTTPYQYALDGGSYGSGATFGNLSSGNHQAYVKDASGCIISQTVNVPLNDNLTVNGGPDVPVCQGKSAVIQATSNGTTFSWQPATGLSNATILQPTVTATANATYTLTATLGACQKTASVNVIYNAAPIADAGPGANICDGKATKLQGSGQGTGTLTYSWTPTAHLDKPSIANPTVSGLTGTTTYQLTVTDGNGCSSLNASYATVTLTPPPRVWAGNDTSVLLGARNAASFTSPSTPGAGVRSIQEQRTALTAVTANPICQPQQTITYLLTGRTFNGCEGTASITVTVYTATGVFVPTAFTPNGDGHNDVFRPVCIDIKELKYFAVFDRWGRRVFYSTNQRIGWRGESNGKDDPMGTYVWMLEAVDMKGNVIQQKGTVLLIR